METPLMPSTPGVGRSLGSDTVPKARPDCASSSTVRLFDCANSQQPTARLFDCANSQQLDCASSSTVTSKIFLCLTFFARL
jgi:hypothetical protein